MLLLRTVVMVSDLCRYVTAPSSQVTPQRASFQWQARSNATWPLVAARPSDRPGAI